MNNRMKEVLRQALVWEWEQNHPEEPMDPKLSKLFDACVFEDSAFSLRKDLVWRALEIATEG